MPGNGFTAAAGGIPVNGMGATLALEWAAVSFEMTNELPALHARASGISFSPFPKLARASSRRSSSRSRIDSRSDASASSSVSPCPLPSGNSGENAMNHFPSRTIRAVKVAAFFINLICSQWEIVASAEFLRRQECLMRIVQSKYFSAKPSAFSAPLRFDLVRRHSQESSRAPLEDLGKLLENHFKEWYTRRDSNP